MNRHTIDIACFVLGTLLLTGTSEGAPLSWWSGKTPAFAEATNTGKLVILMAGRTNCPNCIYMKGTVCETVSPAVKQMIEEAYVPWFSNVDASSQFIPYASGLGSFVLPLMSAIDVRNSAEVYLGRRTNVCDAATLLTFLRTNAQKIPPVTVNLTNRMAVGESNFVVQGRWWTNLQATGLVWRITNSARVAPWQTVAGTTNWSAPLGGFPLVPGTNTFQAYSRYSGTTLPSRTNSIQFVYNPAPPKPAISAQPAAQWAVSGSNAVFTVGAAGSGLDYLWYRNGSLVQSGDNPILTITNAGHQTAGGYYCVVSNQSGAVTSVTAGLWFHDLRYNPRPQLRIYGPAGRTCRVDYASGLPTSNWTTLTNLNVSGFPEVISDADGDGRSQRYYRTGILP